MSSALHARLTSDELAFIQKVLCDAGYTGNVMTSLPADFNHAAKLLIGLFRRGMRDPTALAKELNVAFGRHTVEVAAPLATLYRHAIRGLVPVRSKPSH